MSPRDDEPIVNSGVNKFFGTKLDDYLKAKNIKTVIVCGTSSIGAARVLTASTLDMISIA